ncbi:dethiobiotin synthase [Legionella longbeachae]|uniref:ATP-dependent dethiobiotin synthetase BioD n=1 Tax=Legionella longbeachae serogroup 1 (strain NSW150) TaxID=661367 RepID=D3HT64_LEGLN|nr:dethiobiotin synthase [Legionella longbeachae]VEE02598.1 Dethiobiotin synthetase [Legionella oakridgensis]HBD7397860.1 dethiobiotin synthase [Legionella pneumophila]ARB91136.1 dethiobiotin synthase [Legionella longbeachae]ARM32436.1 dethiobiotin synthase [Legionella longbeachae]EEZ94754.1 dethiobiotin synthase [Legionella longbeachae D-4968]
MRRYFITGTDTDCGKTYVTARLVDYFFNAAAIKPVASGCIEIENQLISHDAQLLIKNNNFDLDLINPWRFKLPISPHIAAEKEGVRLSITEIADYCLNLNMEGVEQLFIEGAGGLMVPLNYDETWIDWLKITQIPVVVVVGIRLGCINHALLTEAALNAHKIECIGWIANCIDPNMQALSENIDTLVHKLESPLLATVPFESNLLDLHFWPGLDNSK